MLKQMFRSLKQMLSRNHDRQPVKKLNFKRAAHAHSPTTRHPRGSQRRHHLFFGTFSALRPLLGQRIRLVRRQHIPSEPEHVCGQCHGTRFHTLKKGVIWGCRRCGTVRMDKRYYDSLPKPATAAA